jgi:hypothetical protein
VNVKRETEVSLFSFLFRFAQQRRCSDAAERTKLCLPTGTLDVRTYMRAFLPHAPPHPRPLCSEDSHHGSLVPGNVVQSRRVVIFVGCRVMELVSVTCETMRSA